MDVSEQWLSNGNCNICRRKKYCGKPCKQAKKAKEAKITGIIASIIYDAMTKGGQTFDEKNQKKI